MGSAEWLTKASVIHYIVQQSAISVVEKRLLITLDIQLFNSITGIQCCLTAGEFDFVIDFTSFFKRQFKACIS
ncbi:hypothetical protein ACT2CL_00675 [Candidatus Karelsulcia muelleri]